MALFLNIHSLVRHMPSNINRDDVGRPKTALLNNTLRARWSSQSQKRMHRTSTSFTDGALSEHMGVRTRMVGSRVMEHLMGQSGLSEAQARPVMHAVVGALSPMKEGSDLTGQIMGLSNTEIAALCTYAGEIAAQPEMVAQLTQSGTTGSEGEVQGEAAPAEVKAPAKRGPKSRKAKAEGAADAIKIAVDRILSTTNASIENALFGRMMSSNPQFNIDAAVSVAHAITVNQVTIEDDFFTAVDDIVQDAGDTGSAHMGNFEYVSGVFYGYMVVNLDLLIKNLGGDADLARMALQALIESVCTSMPGAKQSNFASYSVPEYVRLEISRQPLTAGIAFYDPVRGEGLFEAAADLIRKQSDEMAFRMGWAKREVVDGSPTMVRPEGTLLEMQAHRENNTVTLDQLIEFAGSSIPAEAA